MKKLIYFIIPIVTACTTPQPNLFETSKKLNIDQKILELCDDLDKLDNTIDFNKLAEHYINLIGLYGKCKSKQETSVKTLKGFINDETP